VFADYLKKHNQPVGLMASLKRALASGAKHIGPNLGLRMSALGSKADIYAIGAHVREVPEADKPLSGRREHNARPHAGFGNECDFPLRKHRQALA
jgi:hypothetical protein